MSITVKLPTGEKLMSETPRRESPEYKRSIQFLSNEGSALWDCMGGPCPPPGALFNYMVPRIVDKIKNDYEKELVNSSKQEIVEKSLPSS